MWNKDEIKGKGKQVSGAIKDKAGELIKDPKLEAKGGAERIAGKFQEKSGKARRKTGESATVVPFWCTPARLKKSTPRRRRNAAAKMPTRSIHLTRG